MKVKILSVLTALALLWACDSKTTSSILNTTNSILGGNGSQPVDLTPTNDEVISGLKEALSTGATNSAGIMEDVGHYFCCFS